MRISDYSALTAAPLSNKTLVMEEIPVTRIYLESLTTDELMQVADNWGVDIPYGLDRIFIIEELLETVSEDEEDTGISAEMDLEDSGLIESAPLPKQYNITFIEVIVRDPLWVFVFWEIKTQDKEQFEKAQDFSGYYLKVSPLERSRDNGSRAVPRNKDESDRVFKVQVTPVDTSWYIGFTPAGPDGISPDPQCLYRVELCVVLKGEETILATSNPFKLPGLSELPSGSAKLESYQKPLGLLSGYKDFHILRNGDRLSRTKRGR